ncbi:hypothetical protein M758_UG180200 [Ceratodon purpureus]|nr:hypothetical protein M758_UG180200 [Ceratodon purpureus]
MSVNGAGVVLPSFRHVRAAEFTPSVGTAKGCEELRKGVVFIATLKLRFAQYLFEKLMACSPLERYKLPVISNVAHIFTQNTHTEAKP